MKKLNQFADFIALYEDMNANTATDIFEKIS